MSETLKWIVALVGRGEVRISDHGYDELARIKEARLALFDVLGDHDDETTDAENTRFGQRDQRLTNHD